MGVWQYVFGLFVFVREDGVGSGCSMIWLSVKSTLMCWVGTFFLVVGR